MLPAIALTGTKMAASFIVDRMNERRSIIPRPESPITVRQGLRVHPGEKVVGQQQQMRCMGM